MLQDVGGELFTEFLGLVDLPLDLAPNDLQTVGAGHQALEAENIVVNVGKRPDRGQATGPQCGEEGPLGGDPSPGLPVIQRVRQFLGQVVAHTHFQRQRPLPRRRQQDLRVDKLIDPVPKVEAQKPRGSNHDGMVLTAAEFVEARIHISAKGFHLEVRPVGEELRPTAHRAGAHHRTLGQVRKPANTVAANERVPGVHPPGDGDHPEPVGLFGGQILERMDGDVHLAAEEGVLELLDEDAPLHRIGTPVARRGHGTNLEFGFRPEFL